jgi:hypothetical protein
MIPAFFQTLEQLPHTPNGKRPDAPDCRPPHRPRDDAREPLGRGPRRPPCWGYRQLLRPRRPLPTGGAVVRSSERPHGPSGARRHALSSPNH